MWDRMGRPSLPWVPRAVGVVQAPFLVCTQEHGGGAALGMEGVGTGVGRPACNHAGPDTPSGGGCQRGWPWGCFSTLIML